jgi:hypothetical protein
MNDVVDTGTVIRARKSSSIATKISCGSHSTLHASIRSSTRCNVVQASGSRLPGAFCSTLMNTSRGSKPKRRQRVDVLLALGAIDFILGHAGRRHVKAAGIRHVHVALGLARLPAANIALVLHAIPVDGTAISEHDLDARGRGAVF